MEQQCGAEPRNLALVAPCGATYQTVVADPPWWEKGGGKIKRGADRHYELIRTRDMPRIFYTSGVFSPADNSHLYLWATNNFLEDGLWLMKALGFRYVTCRTWAKDRIGLGQYWRGQTEQLLFGVRGRLPAKVRTESTLIEAPRGKHSEKPAVAYDQIRKVSPGPYLEMFARDKRDGWTTWGRKVLGC